MNNIQKAPQKSVGVLFPCNNPKEKAPAYSGKVTLRDNLIQYLREHLAQGISDELILNAAIWLYRGHVSVEFSPFYRSNSKRRQKERSKPISTEEFFAEEPDDLDPNEFSDDQ